MSTNSDPRNNGLYLKTFKIGSWRKLETILIQKVMRKEFILVSKDMRKSLKYVIPHNLLYPEFCSIFISTLQFSAEDTKLVRLFGKAIKFLCLKNVWLWKRAERQYSIMKIAMRISWATENTNKPLSLQFLQWKNNKEPGNAFQEISGLWICQLEFSFLGSNLEIEPMIWKENKTYQTCKQIRNSSYLFFLY